MNSVFVGFDSTNYGQELAYEVCHRSIRKYNSNIPIHKLIKKDLEDQNIFRRIDNTGATEFTYTRFLTPLLSNYQGWSLFCDSDFLWFCDPNELIEECIEKNKVENKAVYCVKHKYIKCNGKEKMDGRKQEWYPKKNWSSLMVFNNSHPSIKNLSQDNVNIKSPKWLHRMEWCEEEEVGEIDKEYNYLVSYYHDNKYKALHFTDGGPWHPKYQDVEFGDLWLNYISDNEKNIIFYENWLQDELNNLKTIKVEKSIRKHYTLEKILSNNNFSICLEFGVYKGKTCNLISRHSNIVYGFDSFEGLPERWNKVCEKNTFKLSKLPNVNKNVILIKGLFQNTLEIFLKRNKNINIDLIHIDCDLYSSTIYVLKTLKKYNKLKKNLIIVFDEIINYHTFYEGEIKALYEIVKQDNIKFEWIGTHGNIMLKDEIKNLNYSFKEFRDKGYHQEAAIRLL